MTLTGLDVDAVATIIRHSKRGDEIVYFRRPDNEVARPGPWGAVFYALWLRGAFNLAQRRGDKEILYIAQRTRKAISYGDIMSATKWFAKRPDQVRVG